MKKLINELADKFENSITNNELEKKEDINFEQINVISYQAFEMAKKKLNDENFADSLDIKQKVEQLQELLKLVKVCNMEEAKILVSEAILDFNFYLNSRSKITSLRLGRIIRQKKNNK